MPASNQRGSSAARGDAEPRRGRAAVITAPKEIRIEEVTVEHPQDGHVRIRLEGCGMCASGVPLWEGREWFEYPREPGSPGHEGWGIVDAVGRGVEGYEAGNRVAALSYHSFADYDVVPASSLVKLPPQLDGRPFPAEPLACAINVMRRSDILPGHTVAIVGIGFLGALLTQMVAAAGARVIAISRRATSLEHARKAGAAEIITIGEQRDVVEQVMQLTGGSGCDRVIEATGKQRPLDLASELMRVRGRLVIAGYHQDGLRQVNMQLWNWRGIDVINAHERDERVYVQGMRKAVEAVTSERLEPEPLLTHEFSLEELPEAFEIIRERPEGYVKAWIRLAEDDEWAS